MVEAAQMKEQFQTQLESAQHTNILATLDAKMMVMSESEAEAFSEKKKKKKKKDSILDKIGQTLKKAGEFAGKIVKEHLPVVIHNIWDNLEKNIPDDKICLIPESIDDFLNKKVTNVAKERIPIPGNVQPVPLSELMFRSVDVFSGVPANEQIPKG